MYSEVFPTLNLLRSAVHTVLGDALVGMYVHGSLATDDFEPERSDVDVLVVTNDSLPASSIAELSDMHAQLQTHGLHWLQVLEVSYIPQQALRRYDPANAQHPALRVDGSFAIDTHGVDWIIQRHVIRERGIPLFGPVPNSLVDPITPDDLRQAARGILEVWWRPQLSDHTRIQHDEYQVYAILTMCRSLYTLRQGEVATKSQAAHWAQAQLGEPYMTLIEYALSWRHGQQFNQLDQTLALIELILTLP